MIQLGHLDGLVGIVGDFESVVDAEVLTLYLIRYCLCSDISLDMKRNRSKIEHLGALSSFTIAFSQCESIFLERNFDTRTNFSYM